MTNRSRVWPVLVTIAFAAPVAAQGVPNPDLDRTYHALRRATWGPTQPLVQQLLSPIGSTPLQKLQAYLQQQLAPTAASDPFWPYGSQAVRDMVQPGGVLGLPASLGPQVLKINVDSAQLAYGLDSMWQLRDVLGQVWEKFFNTSLISQKFYFASATPNPDDYVWFLEWQANEFYRQNALTTFHDLLRFTAQHASMMIYLHMPQNVVGTPNEDFAREVLELFTMGRELPQPSGPPIQNYDQSDVEKVARVLTGWSVDPNNQYAFVFNSVDHDYPTTAHTLFAVSGSPVTLPLPVAPDGIVEGLRLLRQLAGRPATADFVCRRLIDTFVGEDAADAPGSTLLANMKAAWGQLGDLRGVMNVLLTSNDFLGTSWHDHKACIPQEAVLRMARGMGAQIPLDAVTGLPVPTCLWTTDAQLLAMGQSLLSYGAPNGFPTYVAAQLSPSIALERAKLGALSLFSNAALNLKYDVVGFVQAQLQPAQYQDFLAVNDVLLGSLYGSHYSLHDETQLAAVMAGAVAWINLFGTGPLTPPFNPNLPAHYLAVVATSASAAMGLTQSGLR
jgi:hypothetical protein